MARISRPRGWIERFGQFTLALAGGLLSAGLLAVPAHADPPTWATRFNKGSVNAYASPAFLGAHGVSFPVFGSHAVAADAQGNVYVAGSITPGSLDDQDFLVVKYDAAGNLLWYRTSDGGSHLEDTAFCLALSSDAVFVTGETCKTGNCDPDFLTVKYDAASGAQLWAVRADGPGNDWDTSPCVAVDAAGDAFVAGTTTNPLANNFYDFLTIKYNRTNGGELWRMTKSTGSAPSSDSFAALAVGTDGNPVVTGAGEDNLLTVKYNGANGTELWTADDPFFPFAYAAAIALDGANNPIVVGQGDYAADEKFLTVKYSAANGQRLWYQKVNYDPTGADEGAHDIAVDGSGNAYVTGRLWLNNAYWFLTVKYAAADGTQSWSHYQGTGTQGDDYVPTALAYDAVHGRVVVTGYRGPGGSQDFFTEFLNASDGNNAPLAVSRNGAGNGADLAVAVAVDGSGNTILAGLSQGLVNADFLLVKYDDTLQEAWARSEPALDAHDLLGSLTPPELGGKKIALDSLGNTVLVGSTAPSASSSGRDFLIVKYGPGGDPLWWRTVDGGFGDDFATAVVLDGANNIYVTGWSTGNGTGFDMLTLRLDPANGNTVWSQRYDGAAHSSDVSYSLALGKIQAPGGDGVFVAGASFDGAKFNATVLGYPVADGNSPWVSTLNFGSDSFAYAVAAGCQAKVFNVCQPGVWITGLAVNAASATSGNDFLTALLDGTNGGSIWGGLLLATGDEVGYAIAAVGNPSTVVVTGHQDGDWLTAVLNGASPTPTWTVRKDFDARDDQPNSVAFDSTGNVFVTGFATQTPARNKQVALVKYAGANGAELGVSRVGPTDEDLTGYAVATDFAGDVFVAGSRFSLSSQKNDFMYLRYSNDPGLVASDFFDFNGSDDLGYALAVDPNSGDAVVAGTSFGPSSAGDFLIAKYRAPGQGRFFTTAPCRLYDSRNDPNGPISGGQTRVIFARGQVGNCPLLTSAVKALAVNITAVGATGPGSLLVFPANIAPPITSVLYFRAGQTRANNAVLSLAFNGAGTFAIRPGMQPSQTVHVLVDVTGYFD